MWREFFNSDPFEGFDPAPHPDDLQGWGDDDPIFEALVKFKRPKIIVEVGSWKGASAIRMARACRELGLDTKIVCIDTWLGSLEMYVRREKELAPCPYAALAHRHGWPQLYYQFLANVIRQGFAGVITPLPLPSAIAAQLLARRGIMPDLIYIDASHDYESVKADIQAWLALKTNCLTMGHIQMVHRDARRGHAAEIDSRAGYIYIAPGKRRPAGVK